MPKINSRTIKDFAVKSLGVLKHFSFFIALIFFGCHKGPTAGIDIVSQDEFIKLVDTISIAINKDQLGQYAIFHISYDGLLSGYNKLLHRIDVFDLESRVFSHSVQLDKKGPNGIPSVLFLIKNDDHYLIKSGHFIIRVSKAGVIVNKKPIDELEISTKGYTLQVHGTEILDFQATTGQIENESFLLPIYKYHQDGKIDLSSSFMGSINVNDWTSSIMPVSYPKKYIELYTKIGFLGSGHMIRNRNLLIYNFPGMNEVYVYNIQKQKLGIHDPYIQNSNEMAIDFSDYGGGDPFFAQMDGQMFSPRYLGIEYNGQSNTYYRMHKTKARKRSINRADYFLVKMDSCFNTLVQYNIHVLFRPKFQIHKGYLYFISRDIDEDALHTLKLYRMKG